ncbi:MAG: NAD(P)/FAD-dependent oxidoreductase [Pseudomonadales bacterium]
MPEARLLPDTRGRNGWSEAHPPIHRTQSLQGQHRVKTVIVGAGICGMATAHKLAEHCPDDDIYLIEAERVGIGASGSNAGFMLNIHSHGPPKDTAILRRNIRLWETGLNDLRLKVELFQIQCDWSEAGRFYGAAGPDGEKHLDEIAQTLDQLEQAYTWQSQSELHQKIGTNFYTRGMHAPGNALVNPAALMSGLAHSLPANVTLFEDTPVQRFDETRDGYAIQTVAGEIVADRLVLACGVFLEHFGIAKRQFVPMGTYASMTAPLNGEQLNCLGEADEFGLLGASAYGSTIRLTRDKRLFVRNYFNFNPGASPSVNTLNKTMYMHRHAMVKRWPGLRQTEFETTWGGVMAFTQNNGGVFGEFKPNLFAILTNDVSPMTRGAAAGALLADLMEGRESDLLALQLSIPEASRLPPRPFLDLGIAWHKGALRWAARQEF